MINKITLMLRYKVKMTRNKVADTLSIDIADMRYIFRCEHTV